MIKVNLRDLSPNLRSPQLQFDKTEELVRQNRELTLKLQSLQTQNERIRMKKIQSLMQSENVSVQNSNRKYLKALIDRSDAKRNKESQNSFEKLKSSMEGSIEGRMKDQFEPHGSFNILKPILNNNNSYKQSLEPSRRDFDATSQNSHYKPAQFIGTDQKKNKVTELLETSQDKLRDKQDRQIVFKEYDEIFNEIQNEQQLYRPDIKRAKQRIIERSKKDREYLLKKLRLPEFDIHEKVEVRIDEDMQEDEEDKDHKDLKLNVLRIIILINRKIRKNKMLKVVVRVILMFNQLLFEVRRQRMRQRIQFFDDFNKALPLYNEIFQFQEEKLDFMEEGFTSQAKRQSRLMQIRIRVKSILDGLIEYSIPKTFPQPLLVFFSSYFSENTYQPVEQFSKIEMKLLKFDQSGAFNELDSKCQMLVIGSYIFCKVLINKILFKPIENGITQTQNQTILWNFKIIGNVILSLFQYFIAQLFSEDLINIGIGNPASNVIDLCKIIDWGYNFDDKTLSLNEMHSLYSEGNIEWFQDMIVKIRKVLQLIIMMIKNKQ
ncbi:UNKNOWN [Stylonychia lemnae]|uniref:Uncharacterized protein n=1 Tax=Stylonychia lemnae TaxID=5949 RepID=A0A078AIS9_STYLE|nr:UNKNOWN [Stylonychia lemnae]|eukprot:CDW82195.1 UNKNOWN [Stylonychia lemnae]